MVLGILMIIEALFGLLFPKTTLKIVKKMKLFKWFENPKTIRVTVLLELVIGLVLLIGSFFMID
ncbi:hypothetical protein CMI47_02205 [Candidatus Pacearchaeota archaeon]|nr:hypothetical protein [Candidatus Pacearchaeota archaeon]